MRKNNWGPLCNVVSDGTISWENVLKYGDGCGISELERNNTVGYIQSYLNESSQYPSTLLLEPTHCTSRVNEYQPMPRQYLTFLKVLCSLHKVEENNQILQIQEDSFGIFC